MLCYGFYSVIPVLNMYVYCYCRDIGYIFTENTIVTKELKISKSSHTKTTYHIINKEIQIGDIRSITIIILTDNKNVIVLYPWKVRFCFEYANLFHVVDIKMGKHIFHECITSFWKTFAKQVLQRQIVNLIAEFTCCTS